MKAIINEDTFSYFNTDVNLLVLHILLEGFYREQTTFTLDQFFKGDYWKIDEINDEIKDTNDYGSPEELVVNQILRIISDFELGTVKRISIGGLHDLTEWVVRQAVQAKSDSEDDVYYYTDAIEQIYALRQIKDAQNLKEKEEGKPYSHITHDRLDFTAGEFGKHLNGITKLCVPHIELEIVFNKEQIKKVGEAIKGYVMDFSKDGYLRMSSPYKPERLYFSRQLENFYNFIKDMPIMDGAIDIPFFALTEEGFEVIKVLSFLAIQKKIDIRHWDDRKAWNVKFHVIPITRQGLISDQTKVNPDNLKANLSFDEAKSIIQIGDKTVKIGRTTDQYHLLRIIFEDIAAEWFYSEIAEKYDDEAKLGDKKFYNAAYQVKQKIIRDTGLQDVLITTNQSVRINPKYLNKT